MQIATRLLIEGPPAIGSTTEARDFFILNWELVVVSDFFSEGDVALRVNNNLFAGVEVDDLGVAVGLWVVTGSEQINLDAQCGKPSTTSP